jgi:tRNA (uracil-5-)-methyltransferase
MTLAKPRQCFTTTPTQKTQFKGRDCRILHHLFSTSALFALVVVMIMMATMSRRPSSFVGTAAVVSAWSGSMGSIRRVGQAGRRSPSNRQRASAGASSRCCRLIVAQIFVQHQLRKSPVACPRLFQTLFSTTTTHLSLSLNSEQQPQQQDHPIIATVSTTLTSSAAVTGVTASSSIITAAAIQTDATETGTTNASVEATNVADAVPFKFVNFPFAYHEQITVTIETVTNRGWGLGRVVLAVDSTGESVNKSNQNSNHKDNYNGNNGNEIEQTSKTNKKWVIMVPNVIPGEVVVVKIFRNFDNYSEGDLVSIIQPSPDRISPLCPLADTCGGCQFQHMSIAAQRKLKTLSVQDSLRQFNLLPAEDGDDNGDCASSSLVHPTVGTDEIFAYRSKLTPHYDAPTSSNKRRNKKGVRSNPTVQSPLRTISAIGFQKQSSRSILDVESCPIATPAVNAAYQQARHDLLAQPSARTKGATLLFREDDTRVTSNHHDWLTTTVHNIQFTYQAGNFFQNNYYVLPLMVDHVAQHVSGMTHLVDCYCGSGLFALSLAHKFATVVGIEINDKAAAEASQNALNNRITNCQFRAAPAEAIFRDIGDVFPRESTAVVLDPPRKGCSDEFLTQLYQFAPQRILYMSCDPQTQARDAAGIVAAGYAITSVQPFDLFPQTRHIECLMILERNVQ